ncbi:MAG: 5'/3'-nucleotidase SurE, partial [Solirubrobacterales bacterium]|nr:5'/3'-nucleotidase SurE [Solirubrobacterales bacterium]
GITLRRDLDVEERSVPGATAAFAVTGTPVDCVRLAVLGLAGPRPEAVVSGANLGLNLGDDVTYSGTVAAALEGIVLGIPALAVSQQAARGEMGFRARPGMDFTIAASLTRELVARHLTDPLPPETLLNVNVPAGEVEGIEITRLGKRLYNDELRLVEEDERGRKRYEMYGFEPSFEDEDGTDLAAIARGRVALTPIHFDLTDAGGLETLRAWDAEGMLDTATERIARPR